MDYRHADTVFLKKYTDDPFRKIFWIMVPLISIIGLWYPLLGLLMVPMMTYFLVTSLKRGRTWCGTLCPRGSFLDYLVKPLSRYTRIPYIFRSKGFRLGFLLFFFSFFGIRTVQAFGSSTVWTRWGSVFVMLCLITTTISLVLGLLFSPRTWCSFCPMGTTQKGLFSLASAQNAEDLLTFQADQCVDCSLCHRSCPMQLAPQKESCAETGRMQNLDCIRCGVCVEACPRDALILQ